jgi:hypothetical protein
MIAWPPSLVAEIAERRCVIVLGAGVSASCRDNDGSAPRGWESLLTLLRGKVVSAADSAEAEKEIVAGHFLDAAQIVVDALPPQEVAEVIRDEFQRRQFAPSALVKNIASLDAKVVITTNYDEIYERYCQQGLAGESRAYVVKRYHDDNVLDEIRSTTRLIMKAHGCVTDPSQIVLSRSQYYEARESRPAFFRVLDSLFLTSTLLFFGSSLSDPDFHLLLENANMAARSVYPHYAIVESGRHPAMKRAIRATYNIQLLEYEPGNHHQVESAAEELVDLVSAFRADH